MAEDISSKASELMKKVLTVGVGAIFLTEESLRALVSEFKLPKELLTAIFDSASKTKTDFMQSLSREVIHQVTQKIEPKELLEEILAKNEINLEIKVSFTPKKKG
jgi:hypothetical protein